MTYYILPIVGQKLPIHFDAKLQHDGVYTSPPYYCFLGKEENYRLTVETNTKGNLNHYPIICEAYLGFRLSLIPNLQVKVDELVSSSDTKEYPNDAASISNLD